MCTLEGVCTICRSMHLPVYVRMCMHSCVRISMLMYADLCVWTYVYVCVYMCTHVRASMGMHPCVFFFFPFDVKPLLPVPSPINVCLRRVLGMERILMRYPGECKLTFVLARHLCLRSSGSASGRHFRSRGRQMDFQALRRAGRRPEGLLRPRGPNRAMLHCGTRLWEACSGRWPQMALQAWGGAGRVRVWTLSLIHI